MPLTLDKIKQMYQFQVTQLLLGEEVVKKGKCSQWTRRKETKNDKDLVYLHLRIGYHGLSSKSLLYLHFHLEDSDGYFNKAMPPEDYIERKLRSGQKTEGGILFALYKDIKPMRLWFDTGLCYENSSDPILIDISIPMEDAETRTQFFDKEDLARYYTREMAVGLEKQSLRPRQETENLIKEWADKSGIPHKKIANGYMLRIALPDSRKQNVIVNFSGKDGKGNDLVTIGTICAPARNDKNDRIFLKMNPKLACGAVGISTIQGEDYYVITETLPSCAVKKEVIAHAVQTIAAKGDWLEDKLTGGKDIQ